MLHRRTTEGVTFYFSARLQAVGIPHAFSTRRSGVSPPPFDSMNLGNPNGCAMVDDTAHIAENYRRLQAAIGCESRRRFWTHQVHGGAIADADAGLLTGDCKADGIVTRDSACVISIRTADCVPVLLAADDGSVVAACHAGWRGVIARVVPNAISRMEVTPQRLLAAIGPAISFDAFEVGQEVLAEFERDFPDNPPFRRDQSGGGADPGGKGHVDLQAALVHQLRSLGLTADQIDTTDRCTVRDQDEFFSHRRDHGITGRMASLIGCTRR